MIGVVFQFGNEIVEVRINGGELYFRTSTFGSQFVPLESLKIDKSGALKDNPDLKDDIEWRMKAINRLKDKVKTLGSDRKRAEYVINDLKRYGYIPMYMQEAGHRVVKL